MQPTKERELKMNKQIMALVKNNQQAMLKQVDEEKINDHIRQQKEFRLLISLLAVEIGYKHCELGASLDEAKQFIKDHI